MSRQRLVIFVTGNRHDTNILQSLLQKSCNGRLSTATSTGYGNANGATELTVFGAPTFSVTMRVHLGFRSDGGTSSRICHIHRSGRSCCSSLCISFTRATTLLVVHSSLRCTRSFRRAGARGVFSVCLWGLATMTLTTFGFGGQNVSKDGTNHCPRGQVCEQSI